MIGEENFDERKQTLCHLIFTILIHVLYFKLQNVLTLIRFSFQISLSSGKSRRIQKYQL